MSSNPQAKPTEFTNASHKVLRANYEKLVQIPDGPFFATQLPTITGAELVDYMGYGMVRKVGEWDYQGRTRVIWEPTERFLDARNEYDSSTSPMEMPCGHTGIHNDGEWIRCKVCKGRWTTEEAQEYIDP